MLTGRTPSTTVVWLSTRQVRDRYGGVSAMWVERRLQSDPRFPRPKKFGRLRFFELSRLEDYERAIAAKAVTADKRARAKIAQPRGGGMSNAPQNNETPPLAMAGFGRIFRRN